LVLIADDARLPVKNDDAVEDSVECGLPHLLRRGLRVTGVVDLARVPLPRHRVADVSLEVEIIMQLWCKVTFITEHTAKKRASEGHECSLYIRTKKGKLVGLKAGVPYGIDWNSYPLPPVHNLGGLIAGEGGRANTSDESKKM
jgi:hypothetical protein